MSKNKSAIAIALFLMATIAVTLVDVLPTAQAQEVEEESLRSFVYIAVSPSTTGVGQDVIIVAWTRDMPPEMGEERGLLDSPTGRAGWYDMTVTVTKPDGTTETLEFPYTDPVGAVWILYTPTDVGTYTLQANFPETWKIGTYYPFIGRGEGREIRRRYEADVSDPVELVVQEEPIQEWQESPLPNDYWTRPISSAARNWYGVAGNWLGGNANYWPQGSSGGNTAGYGYGSAPESAHILWTKPFWIGGVMDERFGTINFQTSHYQGVSFSPTIILDGKVHYTPRYTSHGSQGWAILDLYTGETLFLDYDGNKPSFGQVYLYESGNQHGGFAYLWRTSGVTLPEVVQVPMAELEPGNPRRLPTQTSPVQTFNTTETPIRTGTVWEMCDAYTMETVCYIANVSSGGTGVYGKDGSILRYNTVNLGTTAAPNYYLQVWNSSHGTMVASQLGTGAWQWRPAGGTFGGGNPYLGGVAYNYVHDGNDFFCLNVSIPSILGPRNARSNQTGSIRAVREGDYIIIGTTGANDEQGVAPVWMMGLSLERDKEGTKLWDTTFTPPSSADRETVSFTGVYPEDGVILFHSSTSLKRWAYSLETGTLLWESEPEPQMNYYSMAARVYRGLLLGYGSYAGTMIAYNITTGDILWTYTAENIGSESPYGNYPMSIGAIADGKIYTYTSEHSYTHPLYRGPNLRCINASDGTEIWSILDFGGGLAIADGRLLSSNSMDNQIYCYGKGPSATTVTASPKISVHGTSVLIEGTVTDDTPTGRRTTNDILDFTLKGTPAISDEDMSAWMEYMFMQQERPENAKGVEVVLETLDPNGNFYEIGRTTSDVNGNFGLKFTPEVPGEYQILATFAGSKSYGPSYTSTYLSVEEAPQATPTAPPPEPSMADMYIVPGIVGIIIAIVAVGLVLLLVLRKH
jgi:outer membrane protein assembly factor BamB